MQNLNKSLQQVMKFRIEKLSKIREAGIEPYPHCYAKSHQICEILADQESFMKKSVQIAGRVVSLRKMGKAGFAHIMDSTAKIQVYIKNDLLKPGEYDNIFRNLDIGDFIGISGELFTTKMGEFSVKATELIILSKSIRPLPNLKEKDGKVFFSFDDKELRYRYRHLDLIANTEVKETFKKRAKIINEVRYYLDSNGFTEVETPVLQPVYGGAFARPFTTHHNALNQPLFLRIADELYLKRLIIGGFEKVYEIGKDFRNEGIDKNHNPEFTMLEFYQAYADVYQMSSFVESLIHHLAHVTQVNTLNLNDEIIPLDKKFDKIDFFNAIENIVNVKIKDYNKKKLEEFAKSYNVEYEKNIKKGKLLDKIFSTLVEPTLLHPTFVFNYPKELSPLAKNSRNKEVGIVERFELFIGGMEIANSFTELNDPIDQRARFEEQADLKMQGDDEAQEIDENFLEAMECGMPPTGGVGIGIDRLVMLFTGKSNIKDVILFPALRSEV